MNWILLILVVVAMAVVGALLWQSIPPLKCPHCGQTASKLVDKSVAYTRRKRTVDISAGGDLGWMIENVFRKRYRCLNCGELWYVEEPE